MKINANDFDNFIKNLPSNIKGFLVYGSDEGYVKYSAKIAKKTLVKDINDPFSHKVLNYNLIKNDYAAIENELYNDSFSFSNDREIIIIENCTESLNKELKTIIDNYHGNKFLLFIAQDLSTKSTLRQFFEKSKDYAIIAFYNLDNAKLGIKINEYLKSKNITFDREIITLFANNTSNNLFAVFNELEKLCLYIHPKTHITIADAEKILSDNMEAEYQELAFAITSGEINSAYKILDKLLNSGTLPVPIIRVLNNYFLRLLQIKLEIKSGNNFPDAIKNLKPPLFFKYVNRFSRDISNWSEQHITRILQALDKAELLIKQNYNEAELILQNLIIYICRIGKDA